MYTANNLANDISLWMHSTFPETSADSRENVKYDDLTVFISNILLQIGIPVNIKGYAYLREAITIKVHDPRSEMPVTKILYPEVAKKFQTTPVRVERAIRHAIKVAWSRAEQYSHDKKLICPYLNYEKRPTNSEFISMIVECIALLGVSTEKS